MKHRNFLILGVILLLFLASFPAHALNFTGTTGPTAASTLVNQIVGPGVSQLFRERQAIPGSQTSQGLLPVETHQESALIRALC
jgi:hypothetical protein